MASRQLKIGDKVRMINCPEALDTTKGADKVFEVTSDEWTRDNGEKLVGLKDWQFGQGFNVDFLELESVLDEAAANAVEIPLTNSELPSSEVTVEGSETLQDEEIQDGKDITNSELPV